MSKTKTLTFTADAAGNPEPVTVQSYCNVVRVRQNDLDLATIAFNMYSPTIADTPIQFSPIGIVEFRAAKGSVFRPNDIPGYIATASGSVVFAQEEGME